MTPDDLPFKIVIPSHGRPEQILKNPLYPVAHTVVRNEASRDAYFAAADKAGLQPGPFHVCGDYANLAAKRNWINRSTCGTPDEPFIFVTDDDLLYVRPTMVWRASRITDDWRHPCHHPGMATTRPQDAGCGIFGWSNAGGPNRRVVYLPVVLRTYIMGQIGIIDRELRYDEQFVPLPRTSTFRWQPWPGAR